MIKFKLGPESEFIELIKLLKVTNICMSGGEAKQFVSDGIVISESLDTDTTITARSVGCYGISRDHVSDRRTDKGESVVLTITSSGIDGVVRDSVVYRA